MSPIVTSCSHWYRCSLPLIYTLHLEINQLSINNKSIAILLWNNFICMLDSPSYMSDKRLVRNMCRNVAACSSSPMCLQDHRQHVVHAQKQEIHGLISQVMSRSNHGVFWLTTWPTPTTLMRYAAAIISCSLCKFKLSRHGKGVIIEHLSGQG